MKTIEEEIQQRKFKSPYQKAVLNLIYTANWIQNKHQGFFRLYGITGQQYNILRILKGQHPKSISATAIKSRMLDQNSDVSRLLDRMAAKDLLTKKTCPNDKRASDVNITQTGLDLLKQIEKKESDIDELLSLTPEEANQLSDLLDKARRSI